MHAIQEDRKDILYRWAGNKVRGKDHTGRFSQTLLLPVICRFVLRELIETEKMYVDDLGQIVEVPTSSLFEAVFPLPPPGLCSDFCGTLARTLLPLLPKRGLCCPSSQE